ncbi:MAG: tetratricopeptide repeat protein [Woeseiaceae bacterium]|nr:tetratricopeptide repeat protein [Woeseiaceae bacterium]
MFMKSVARAPVRLISLVVTVLIVAGCDQSDDTPPSIVTGPPAYVGSQACSTCHLAEFERWQGSHHALAMQAANANTVLGDFSGTEIEHFGQFSAFYEDNGNYYVRTDNAEGELEDFPVRYTFGVMPLQQYLVEFPGGRLQTLPLAWDSRPPDSGGQRWFHIYPDEAIVSDDPLHWTGREQNWNYMCAECHSTNLQKNYDVVTDSFNTTWSEINVGCEGCHGPASTHIAQTESGNFNSRHGFRSDLDDAERAVWMMNADTGIATRSEVRLRPPMQPEACGRCHSRRGVASSEYAFGGPLMDSHQVSLLDDPLYFADGQIREEVYVYGSFLQSRMYQAGVSCGDCHEPHSAELRTGSVPSDICTTCHLPEKFATEDHHRHPGHEPACVDCHMTSRDFMVVDGRRDHSFRIPRPDISAAVRSPDACSGCHADREASWIAASFSDLFGDDHPPHYGTAIHAARTGGGNTPLLAAIGNLNFPGIARATALSLLRPPYSERVAETIQAAKSSGDPLLRLGALRAMPGLQQELWLQWATELLDDPVRALRIEAARQLSPMRGQIHVRAEPSLARAEAELLDAINAIAERPEAQINLGNLLAESGDAGRSEAAFRRAMQMDPLAPAPRANLADLYSRMGRDADAEALLRAGLELRPDDGTFRHALGLLLVRQQRYDEALDELRLAAEQQTHNVRFAYVYAVAMNSMGRQQAAVDYLAAVRQDFPGEFDISWALATMLRDLGRNKDARQVATELAEIYPGVQPVQNLLMAL